MLTHDYEGSLFISSHTFRNIYDPRVTACWRDCLCTFDLLVYGWTFEPLGRSLLYGIKDTQALVSSNARHGGSKETA